MDEGFIDNILKSKQEDKRISWRDQTLNHLEIRKLGGDIFNWKIFEKYGNTCRQLLLGTATPMRPIGAERVLTLADRIAEIKEDKTSKYVFEVKKDYALLTRYYIGTVIAKSDDVILNQNIPEPDRYFKKNNGVMLLGLKYNSGEIDIPEFRHAKDSFDLFAEMEID